MDLYGFDKSAGGNGWYDMSLITSWWQDDALTIQATALPTVGDTIYEYNTDSSSFSVAVYVMINGLAWGGDGMVLNGTWPNDGAYYSNGVYFTGDSGNGYYDNGYLRSGVVGGQYWYNGYTSSGVQDGITYGSYGWPVQGVYWDGVYYVDGVPSNGVVGGVVYYAGYGYTGWYDNVTCTYSATPGMSDGIGGDSNSYYYDSGTTGYSGGGSSSGYYLINGQVTNHQWDTSNNGYCVGGQIYSGFATDPNTSLWSLFNSGQLATGTFDGRAYSSGILLVGIQGSSFYLAGIDITTGATITDSDIDSVTVVNGSVTLTVGNLSFTKKLTQLDILATGLN